MEYVVSTSLKTNNRGGLGLNSGYCWNMWRRKDLGHRREQPWKGLQWEGEWFPCNPASAARDPGFILAALPVQIQAS